jgi:cyanate lyase
MTRDELTRKILAAKRAKGLTWKTIAAEIGGGSAVYLTAALMGQMKLRPEQAERAAKLFELDEDEKRLLQEIPYRGSLPSVVPTDPLIYRFYELVQVYGTTWKELIQEEFGDGIMSAIDFDMAIERQPDPKGDRVKLTLSGKFLPYKELLRSLRLHVIPGRGEAANPEPMNTGLGTDGTGRGSALRSVFMGSGPVPSGHPGMTSWRE